ncbi:50S ribosomal protein L10 [Oscillospiraceae bacterium 21-37]|uniref:50S ribosomal protein L10 n=1 Tax=Eubacteriales TaxID=186802 RepID=UPI001368705D|nr:MULTISPECIES: 50S ribosomal protein L10 [unclassified Neglectibacter]NBI18663.1 50S ribosomal protein L10 [Neglectibacter sp. 59]NBJ74341.1 50S ribosomal protein L10 [Neglectibacter sp. X4]NCE81785.1 50S ribosomal protein L10 [Neglectibacter sp. X58]
MPSEKILEQKQQQVAALKEAFEKANVGVLVNYNGITVEKDTKLRKQLREAGCVYKVVKNTLLSRAFKDAGIEGLDECLNGTTAIAYSENGYTEAPKILSDYAKDNENFQVKAGFIDGGAVDAKSIDALAKLPSKEVLLAQVLGGLNGPIQGFANVLNGTMRGLVIALNAIAEKQGA